MTGQPPAFALQRAEPSLDTQLMMPPVRVFTWPMTFLSTVSRSPGRAPAYRRTLLYTVPLVADATLMPGFHVGADEVRSPEMTSPPVSTTICESESPVSAW